VSLQSHYNKVAVIERIVSQPLRDAAGAPLKDWGTLIENVGCMIQALDASEIAGMGTIAVDCSHRMFCDIQAETITEKDRVKVGAQIYEIKLVDDVAGMGHHL
jgi:head-tail adaptor